MTFAGFSLDDRVALVTGAGQGLGLEIAKALAQAGAHVLVNGRDAEQLAQAVDPLTSAGGSATAIQFDITDEGGALEAFRDIREQYGRLDVLVNNVGNRDRRGLFEFDMDDVRRLGAEAGL